MGRTAGHLRRGYAAARVTVTPPASESSGMTRAGTGIRTGLQLLGGLASADTTDVFTAATPPRRSGQYILVVPSWKWSSRTRCVRARRAPTADQSVSYRSSRHGARDRERTVSIGARGRLLRTASPGRAGEVARALSPCAFTAHWGRRHYSRPPAPRRARGRHGGRIEVAPAAACGSRSRTGTSEANRRAARRCHCARLRRDLRCRAGGRADHADVRGRHGRTGDRAGHA
jgi:hypothetical protein